MAKQSLAGWLLFLDALNVSYCLAPTSNRWRETPGLLLAAAGDLDTYGSPRAWRRAFFSDRFSRYRDTYQLAVWTALGDGRPFAVVLASEGLAPLLPKDQDTPGGAGSRLSADRQYHDLHVRRIRTWCGPAHGNLRAPEGVRARVNGQPAGHVDDVLAAIFTAAEKSTARFDVFNVATDDYITVHAIADIAVAVSELATSTVQYDFTGSDRGWKGDVPIVRFDVSRIKALGWRAEGTSAKAVRDSIATMRAEIANV